MHLINRHFRVNQSILISYEYTILFPVITDILIFYQDENTLHSYLSMYSSLIFCKETITLNNYTLKITHE